MSNNSDEDDFDIMIKRRIESLIGSTEESKRPMVVCDEETDKYVHELLTKVNSGPQKQPQTQRSDETTQKYVKDLMRACFQVEEEALQIKKKVLKSTGPTTKSLLSNSLQSSDLYNSKTLIASKPLKTSALSKQERQVLASASHNEDQAEDAMLALSLLQQYKKDPNFIQKDLKDQAKRRDLVLGTGEQSSVSTTKRAADLFNPVLIQEERHRAINERREQRKKDQRVKQLEESKERRTVKALPRAPSMGMNRDIERIMLHSGTTPQKQESSNGMMDIEKIREAKLKIERDAQESQEEVRKIKQDLKRYKQEILDQEKAKRDLELQQDLKTKMNIDRQRMQQEVEQARQQLVDYRLHKFVLILQTLQMQRLRHLKGQSFQTLSSFSQHLRFKQLKLEKLRRYHIKVQTFRLWHILQQKAIEQREVEAYEREQRSREAREQTADNHRKRYLKRRALRGIKKHTVMMKHEKEIEQEHEQRKNAIDEFFIAMKVKAKEEEDKLKRDKLERLQKDQIKDKLFEVSKAHRAINDVRIGTPSDHESSVPYMITPSQYSQMQKTELSENTIDFDQYQQTSVEESKGYDIFPCRQFDSDIQNNQLTLTPTIEPRANNHQISVVQPFSDQSDQSQQLPTQESSSSTKKLLQRPKHVLEMEERAKTRKDKRDQLKQVYDEKQRKLDEQRKQLELQKEEDKKRKIQEERDLKKRAKLEDVRKKEEDLLELERERERIQEAREYYKRMLLIKYGLIPLSRNVEIVRENEDRADDQYIKWVIINGFRELKVGVKESKYEEYQRQERMMYIAKKSRERKLQRNVMNVLIEQVNESREEQRKLRIFYLTNLMTRAINIWAKAIPALRQERKSIQFKENFLVKKFRLIHIGKQIFNQIREVPRLERLDRDKSAYKQKMWSKVNNWLADIDHKSPTEGQIIYDDLSIEQIIKHIPQPSIEVDEHYSEDFEESDNNDRFSQYEYSHHKLTTPSAFHQEVTQDETTRQVTKHPFLEDSMSPAFQKPFGTIESNNMIIKRGGNSLGMFDDVTITITEKSLENSSRVYNR